MANIESKVTALISGPIKDLGYLLYDVEYEKVGPNFFLKIYIDSDSQIDLADCEKVSNEISDILDTADYIKEQYFLEVSSPGIERVLRKEDHFKNSIGLKVELKTYKPENGKKQFVGILKEFNNENITIQIDEHEVAINRKNVSLVKTVYDWKKKGGDKI